MAFHKITTSSVYVSCSHCKHCPHARHTHENFNEDAKKNPKSIITSRPHLHFFPLDVEFVFLLWEPSWNYSLSNKEDAMCPGQLKYLGHLSAFLWPPTWAGGWGTATGRPGLQVDQLGQTVSLLLAAGHHGVRGVGDELLLCALAASHGVTARGGGGHHLSADLTPLSSSSTAQMSRVIMSSDQWWCAPALGHGHQVCDERHSALNTPTWPRIPRTRHYSAPQIFAGDFRGKQTTTRNCTKLGRCFVTRADDILMSHSYLF